MAGFWKWMGLTLCAWAVLVSAPQAKAAGEEEKVAENRANLSCVTEKQGIVSCQPLFDGNTRRAVKIPADGSLTLTCEEGFSSAYLVFDVPYGTYTVTDNGTQMEKTFGEAGFLHDFADLEGAFGHALTSVTIRFSSGEAMVNELYLYGEGTLPETVQIWKTPEEGKTDMVLFSTHGDDEQIYFAGLLPTYAGERDYEVLVVYLTDHSQAGTQRRHEMLDGLWAVGVDTYPVFGQFRDLYCKNLKQAYSMHQYFGETEEQLMAFVVEQIRRYKPQVAVGHDPVNGEYGHGQHILYSDLLCRGLELAMDPQQYPESAEAYGTWDVPKTYLHLWEENPIVMDWDQPLERFGGMTAFQVNKELGFPCHKSQYASFAPFFNGKEKATEIKEYSPCLYGLYRTKVGLDSGVGDMFENLTAYAQQTEE